ncbi:MAG: carboxynorspermidine decarboxylase, partial [Ruminococcus sp.]|nr:carboxynorspermidine decarboxylase [Ruminococcus sp.]
RINPEHTTQEGHEIYDPCSPKSRLGITRHNFRADDLRGVTGLHFHTLCEQNSDDLEATLDAVEKKFGDILPKMEWINFGGGHHITREDYDIPRLERCIRHMQEKYGLEVFLEPGEAIALNAGWLVTEVLDLTENDMPIAILDTSAACHMPDVLEMPYRPPLAGSGEMDEKQYSYRLGSQTCLAGDVIGEYSFDESLHIGDRLVFGDMAIYSMVKNNTFNGMPLPSILLLKKDGSFETLRSFGYDDFKERL